MAMPPNASDPILKTPVWHATSSMSSSGTTSGDGNDGTAGRCAPDDGVELRRRHEHNHHHHNWLHHHPEVGKLDLVSKSVFVVGAAFYVAAEATVIDVLKWYQGVPYEVLYADDDATWWQYYNETNAIPAYVLESDSNETTWSAWYNSTFMEDDYIFEVDTRGPAAALVSQYMALYFSAAICFLLMGLVEMYIHRSQRSMVLLYSVIVVAASFGVASAMLTERDSHLSNIFNCVSVQLFALDAVVLVYLVLLRRSSAEVNRTAEAAAADADKDKVGPEDNTRSTWPFCCDVLLEHSQSWELTGSVCFMFGTLMDVVTSYFYVFVQENVQLGITAVVASVFWMGAALCFLVVTSVEYHHCHNKDSTTGDNHGNDTMINRNTMPNADGTTKMTDSAKDMEATEMTRDAAAEDGDSMEVSI